MDFRHDPLYWVLMFDDGQYSSLYIINFYVLRILQNYDLKIVSKSSYNKRFNLLTNQSNHLLQQLPFRFPQQCTSGLGSLHCLFCKCESNIKWIISSLNWNINENILKKRFALLSNNA